jgi:transcriptional regulator with XRE-family HTH domain
VSVRPSIIENEDVLIAKLRGRREARGWSQAELDDRIGWSSAYTSKVEAPHRSYGKRSLWGLTACLAEWLQGLDLCLVLMSRKDAEAMVAASTAPDIGEAHAQAYAGRSREGGLLTSRTLRIAMTFRRAA